MRGTLKQPHLLTATLMLVMSLFVVIFAQPVNAVSFDGKWEVCDALNKTGPDCDNWWIDFDEDYENTTVGDYTIIKDFDDSDYITKTTSALNNYYLKTTSDAKYLLKTEKFSTSSLTNYLLKSEVDARVDKRINQSLVNGKLNTTLENFSDESSISTGWKTTIIIALCLALIAIVLGIKLSREL